MDGLPKQLCPNAQLSQQFQSMYITRNQFFRQFERKRQPVKTNFRTIPISSLRDHLSGQFQLIGSTRHQLFRQLQYGQPVKTIFRTIPINRRSPRSFVWTIPTNWKHQTSIVQSIPINGQSLKSMVRTIPINRDSKIFWPGNSNC